MRRRLFWACLGRAKRETYVFDHVRWFVPVAGFARCFVRAVIILCAFRFFALLARSYRSIYRVRLPRRDVVARVLRYLVVFPYTGYNAGFLRVYADRTV